MYYYLGHYKLMLRQANRNRIKITSMYTVKIFPGWLAVLVFALAATACKPRPKFTSPKEYDLINPQKIVMPPSLEW